MSPTGFVTFVDGKTNATLSRRPVQAGVATLETEKLSLGQHVIVATYEGDVGWQGSSDQVNHLVEVPTRVDVLTPPGVTLLGEQVKLRIRVAAVPSKAGTPSGKVALVDGMTKAPLGDFVLDDSGETLAVLKDGALGPGNHELLVKYEGTEVFHSSSAKQAHLVELVSKVTIASKTGPSVFGEDITLVAEVSATGPKKLMAPGKVVFKDGAGKTLGDPCVLLDGIAVLKLKQPAFAVGEHPITAVYEGSTPFRPGQGAVKQKVGPAMTQVVVTTTPNPSVLNQEVTIEAVVSVVAPGAGRPTGAVDFYYDDGEGLELGNAPLVDGKATIKTTRIRDRGSWTIRAVYRPDPEQPSFQKSASDPQKTKKHEVK
jgi:hypothetical protein